MEPFDHFTPQTLPAALELLDHTNGEAYVIAGGTDLLLKVAAGEITPKVIINIKQLPELKGIEYDVDMGLRIGALTTLREISRSPVIGEHYPSLARTASLMASEQIRCFATIGGNLCNAAPSADLAPPLIALGGIAWISGPAGDRQVPLEDFFLGPGSTVLLPNELLRLVAIPPPKGVTVYYKHSQRAFMDVALVGIAVRLQMDNGVCQEAKVALGAVAPVPKRAFRCEEKLAGQMLTSGQIEQVAKLAAEECSPIDDVRCSADYRRRMVPVLLRRVLRGMVSPIEM